MFVPPLHHNDASESIPERRPTSRGLLLLVLAVLSLGSLYYALVHPSAARQEMTQTQLFNLVKQGRVTSIVNEPDPSTGIRILTGTFASALNVTPATSVGVQDIPNNASGSFQVPVDLQLDPNLSSKLQQAGYKGVIETQNNTNIIWPLILNLLPVSLFGGWILFICVCLTRILYKAAFGLRGT